MEIEANKIVNGDCLEVLKTMPDNSVHCCVTSPPYYALRDYGVGRANWKGGDARTVYCKAHRGIFRSLQGAKK